MPGRRAFLDCRCSATPTRRAMQRGCFISRRLRRRAPQERAASDSLSAVASDNEPAEKLLRAQPEVAAEAAASPGPSAPPPSPAAVPGETQPGPALLRRSRGLRDRPPPPPSDQCDRVAEDVDR